MPAPKKNGSLADPAIRSMRVQAWFRAVSLASGMTAAELEREFSERKTEGTATKRSCIWDKYRRGEALPRSERKTSGELNLVARVEAKFPGTAKWLTSPLWRLVDKAPMEMSEIRQIYEGMPKPIRSIFMASEKRERSLFWRQAIKPEAACDVLLRLQSFDALVALFALAREAEIIQNQYQHAIVIDSIRVYLRKIHFDPIIGLITHNMLFTHIDNK